MEIWADEVGYYHLYLNRRENDPVKKEYIDRTTFQSFTPQDYRQMSASNFFQSNYDTVEILHDPTGVVVDSSTFYEEDQPKTNTVPLATALATEGDDGKKGGRGRGKNKDQATAEPEAPTTPEPVSDDLAAARDTYEQIFGRPAAPELTVEEINKEINS